MFLKISKFFTYQWTTSWNIWTIFDKMHNFIFFNFNAWSKYQLLNSAKWQLLFFQIWLKIVTFVFWVKISEIFCYFLLKFLKFQIDKICPFDRNLKTGPKSYGFPWELRVKSSFYNYQSGLIQVRYI